MTPSTRLLPLAFAIVAVNVPFGYWRAGLRNFSRSWFVAVHAPVPLVVVLRLLFGVVWRLASLPILVGAYFAGQLLGGLLRGWRERRDP
jgi:hypothetical protein